MTKPVLSVPPHFGWLISSFRHQCAPARNWGAAHSAFVRSSQRAALLQWWYSAAKSDCKFKDIQSKAVIGIVQELGGSEGKATIDIDRRRFAIEGPR